MLGKLNLNFKQVTVVGGGFSGLVAAYFLDRSGYEVTLFEAQARVGGIIRTEATPWGIAEMAAHSVLGSAAVQEFFNDLGVEWVPVQNRARFILREGHLSRFPLRVSEALEALYRVGFVRARTRTTEGATAPLGWVDQSPLLGKTPLAESGQITLAQWGAQHFGKAFNQYLLGPMLKGIYATSLNEISVEAAFPRWIVPAGHSLLGWQLRKRYSPSFFTQSVQTHREGGGTLRLPLHLLRKKYPRVKTRMLAPRQGMGSVIEALERVLKQRLGERFKIGQRIESLPHGENLVLAVPAEAAASLLCQADPELSEHLKGIAYTPLMSVTVFVKKSSLVRVPKGVGALMSDGEDTECLGILFNSSSFQDRVLDPQQIVSLSVFMGGSRNPQILDAPDSEIHTRVERELRKRFGLKEAPLDFRISRQKRAIPQYNPHLMKTWAVAQKGWCSHPGQILFGNYTGQVSLRGMIETWRNGLLS